MRQKIKNNNNKLKNNNNSKNNFYKNKNITKIIYKMIILIDLIKTH